MICEIKTIEFISYTRNILVNEIPFCATFNNRQGIKKVQYICINKMVIIWYEYVIESSRISMSVNYQNASSSCVSSYHISLGSIIHEYLISNIKYISVTKCRFCEALANSNDSRIKLINIGSNVNYTFIKLIILCNLESAKYFIVVI